jgi:pilus assembly protein CpaD
MKTRYLPLLCAGAVLLVGAGCTPSTSEWSPSEAPKSARVEYVRLQHVAAFKPGSADLATGEAEKLRRFLDQAQVNAEDHVFLEPGSEDRLTASRIGRLSKAMAEKGVGAQTLPAMSADAALGADKVDIVVERYVVMPPDCPNWTSPAVGEHSNQPGSNFGCATATNLGLMVADPRDLVIGRTLGPAEGDAALAAVKRYRLGKVKDPTPISANTIYQPQAAGGAGAAGGTGGSGDDTGQ